MQTWARNLKGGARSVQQRRLYNFIKSQIPELQRAARDCMPQYLSGGAEAGYVKRPNIIALQQKEMVEKNNIGIGHATSSRSANQKLRVELEKTTRQLTENSVLKVLTNKKDPIASAAKILVRRSKSASKNNGIYGLIIGAFTALKTKVLLFAKLMYRWKKLLVALLLVGMYCWCTLTPYHSLYKLFTNFPGITARSNTSFSLSGLKAFIPDLVKSLGNVRLTMKVKNLLSWVYGEMLNLWQNIGFLLIDDPQFLFLFTAVSGMDTWSSTPRLLLK